MSRMKKILSVLFCLGFLSFGCGSDDDDATPTAVAKLFCDDSTGESKTCTGSTVPSCDKGTKVDACPESFKGKCLDYTLGDAKMDVYYYNAAVVSSAETACAEGSGTWTAGS